MLHGEADGFKKKREKNEDVEAPLAFC